MNLTEYTSTSTQLLDTAASIEQAKRAGYTMGSEDVLANFKRVAERAGLTPGQVWTVYFLKHVDAIAAAMSKPELAQAEPIVGRFADAMNYLKLGFALWSEALWNAPPAPLTEAEPDSGPVPTPTYIDGTYRRFPPI